MRVHENTYLNSKNTEEVVLEITHPNLKFKVLLIILVMNYRPKQKLL